MKTLVNVLCIAALLITGVILTIGVADAGSKKPSFPFGFCITEDDGGNLPCYWDADAQGNGLGTDVLHGYRLLDCGPKYQLLVRPRPMWDEGCQRQDGRPIAMRLDSTIRVMGN